MCSSDLPSVMLVHLSASTFTMFITSGSRYACDTPRDCQEFLSTYFRVCSYTNSSRPAVKQNGSSGCLSVVGVCLHRFGEA